MTFAEPARLALLALPAAAGLLAVYRHRRRRGQQRRLASPGVWIRLLGGIPATGLARLLLWTGAAVMIVLALARPQWGEEPREESVRTRDLVVALDVSASMRCEDIRPSRLTRSVETILRLLPQLEGNRLAVVVFAGEAYPLVPLTTDLSAVGVFLEGVEAGMVALPGSNLQRAVDTSLELLPDEGEGRVLMLFTDGENLQGEVAAATESLAAAGVGLVGVVVGTERGGPIPEPTRDGGVHYKRDAGGQPVVTRAHPEVLETIADELDGEVVSLSDTDVVQQVATAIDNIRTREVVETRTVRRIERFPVFLTAAAGMLFLGFALSPWRRVAAAAFITMIALPGIGAAQSTAPAVAPPRKPAQQTAAGVEEPLPTASLWQRLIPGGVRRLARSGIARWSVGDIEGATVSFAEAVDLEPDAPDRLYDLGTALAATGRVETAQPLFEKAADRGAIDAAFNSGTAALEQADVETALEWLKRAMISNPDDLDAKHNYELALKMLEQQQQQQEQDQQQDQEQDQEQEQEEDQKDQENQEQEKDQEEQQENKDGQQPTPTPDPASGQGAAPTPTPNPNQPLFAALDRAEADAREAMRSPTPQPGKVEKDW